MSSDKVKENIEFKRANEEIVRECTEIKRENEELKREQSNVKDKIKEEMNEIVTAQVEAWRERRKMRTR